METPNPPTEDITIDNDAVEEIIIEAAAPASQWSGLPVRVASAVVLAGAFFMLLMAGGWIFNWFVFLAALIMIREWNNLTKTDEAAWRFAGLFFVSVPCASLVWLRDLQSSQAPDIGMYCVLYVLLCVIATDIGAYFTGKQFGSRKLAPSISPNKTIEGLGGGMAAAGIAGAAAQMMVPFPASIISGALLGIGLAVLAQAGDLFESWLKRRAGVKDSGKLIPGHGGLLDRIDGLIFTLPLFALLISLSKAM